MAHKSSLTPGIVELDNSTLHDTKENIRLDQLIPAEILEDRAKLNEFLKSYYTFMNMDEFIYQETETFTDVVLDNIARFRISDPNNENNKFFTDETGADSTLVLTAPDGTTTNIPLGDINVSITNGNELPGTLAASTSEIGKTFTVLSLNGYNGYSAKLTTIVKYWVGPGPSYVMNNIEKAMNIDGNDTNYLELMQKEIASAIPRDVTVNKRTLYKQLIDFYKLRGSADSIEIFFRLLFNETVEVEFPYDSVLVPSSGDWDQPAEITATVNGAVSNSTSLTISAADENIRLSSKLVVGTTITLLSDIRVEGISGTSITLSDPVTLSDGQSITFVPRGTYLDTKGQLSHNIKIQDSLKFQKFSYVIKTGKNLKDWEFSFDKLVHPAGFVYFAEVVIFINLVDDVLTAAKNLISMPGQQPGVIGPEDIPLLVELFSSTFLPNTIAKIHKSGTLSLTLKNGIITSTTITSGGSGYTAPPTVEADDSGNPPGHTEAVIVATLVGGAVNALSITSGGEDYQIPTLTLSAPTRIVFDGSDFGLSQTVDGVADTITLTAPQVAALPVGSIITYDSGGNSPIGGLNTGQLYRILTTPTATTIQLEDHIAAPGVAIQFGSAGGGTDHGFTGQTATATAAKTDGQLDTVTIVEPGFGYASAPAITFNGIEQSSGSGVAPTVTIGIDSNGRLDEDNVTINTRGGGWTSLFGSVAANPNATSIASVELLNLADKTYKVAPTVVFPQPTAKDADGNPLSTNVLATGALTLDSEGEITGINITNAGSGYILDPIVKLGSQVNNENRVKDGPETVILSLNHTDAKPTLGRQINPRQSSGSIMTTSGSADKFLPEHLVTLKNSAFRTIVNNGYKQRKGSQNFFTSPRLYNTNQTIEFLGTNTIQTIDSSDINNYNTSTFIDIE